MDTDRDISITVKASSLGGEILGIALKEWNTVNTGLKEKALTSYNCLMLAMGCEEDFPLGLYDQYNISYIQTEEIKKIREEIEKITGKIDSLSKVSLEETDKYLLKLQTFRRIQIKELGGVSLGWPDNADNDLKFIVGTDTMDQIHQLANNSKSLNFCIVYINPSNYGDYHYARLFKNGNSKIWYEKPDSNKPLQQTALEKDLGVTVESGWIWKRRDFSKYQEVFADRVQKKNHKYMPIGYCLFDSEKSKEIWKKFGEDHNKKKEENKESTTRIAEKEKQLVDKKISGSKTSLTTKNQKEDEEIKQKLAEIKKKKDEENRKLKEEIKNKKK